MLSVQLKDRCALFGGLVEVVELEVAGGAVAVQGDALRGAPRRCQRRRVELERLPVAAAPVELVRLLHSLRPRHRCDLGLCEPEPDLGEGWADWRSW